MASNEQLVNLLGHALCGSMKHTATGEIEDSDGRIAAGIAGNVFHSLSVISPSVDGAEHVREQARKRGGVVRPPMSNEEIDRLSKLCTSIANAQYAGITLGTGGAGPY